MPSILIGPGNDPGPATTKAKVLASSRPGRLLMKNLAPPIANVPPPGTHTFVWAHRLPNDVTPAPRYLKLEECRNVRAVARNIE